MTSKGLLARKRPHGNGLAFRKYAIVAIRLSHVATRVDRGMICRSGQIVASQFLQKREKENARARTSNCDGLLLESGLSVSLVDYVIYDRKLE